MTYVKKPESGVWLKIALDIHFFRIYQEVCYKTFSPDITMDWYVFISCVGNNGSSILALTDLNSLKQ